MKLCLSGHRQFSLNESSALGAQVSTADEVVPEVIFVRAMAGAVPVWTQAELDFIVEWCRIDTGEKYTSPATVWWSPWRRTFLPVNVWWTMRLAPEVRRTDPMHPLSETVRDDGAPLMWRRLLGRAGRAERWRLVLGEAIDEHLVGLGKAA